MLHLDSDEGQPESSQTTVCVHKRQVRCVVLQRQFLTVVRSCGSRPPPPAPHTAWAQRGTTYRARGAEPALGWLSCAHCPHEDAVDQGWGDKALRRGIRTSPSFSGPGLSPLWPSGSLSQAAVPIGSGELQPNTWARHTCGSSRSGAHTGHCQAYRVPGPHPAGARLAWPSPAQR